MAVVIIFAIAKNCEREQNGAIGTDYTVYCFDVGQADSIFIDTPEKDILIDAGNNSDGDLIVNFLKGINVEKIDYLIATHPHEDHIGGLDNVISAFEIGEIYLPKTAKGDTPKTKTYKDVLREIKKDGCKVVYAKPNQTIIENEVLNFKVLSPKFTDYDGLNEYSIVTALKIYNTDLLFMGDAEKENELQILKDFKDLDTDILKVGHHGSDTSSGKKFIDKISPETAVISCGEDNKYNHPHKSTLNLFKNRKIKTFRTDLDGTIKIAVDKNGYEVTTDKSINLNRGA